MGTQNGTEALVGLPVCPTCDVEHDPRPCAEAGVLCDCCEHMYGSYEAREQAARAIVDVPVLRHDYSGYNHRGCRCEVCRQANADYHRKARARRRMRLAERTGVEHGASTYTNWGCRCEVCAEAHAVEMREYAESRKARTLAGSPDVPHGTYSGYASWYCRCVRCLVAHTAYHRERRTAPA